MDLTFSGRDLAPLYVAKALAGVRHLAVRLTGDASQLDALREAPWAAGVERLSLGIDALDDDTRAWLDDPEVFPSLRELTLSSVPRGAYDGVLASGMVRRCASLSVREWSKESSTELGEALGRAQLPGLEGLDLSTTELGTKGSRALAKATGLGGLQRLNLTGCTIKSAAAKALCKATYAGGLTRLCLARNGINDKAIEAITKSPLADGLLELDLSGNDVQPGSGRHLSTSPRLRHLRRLAFSGSNARITQESVDAIARSPHLTRLTYLDLSEHYPLGEDAVRAIAGSSTLAALEWLRLSPRGVDAADTLSILAASSSLTRLRFVQTSSDKRAMVPAFVKNTRFKHAWPLANTSHGIKELAPLEAVEADEDDAAHDQGARAELTSQLSEDFGELRSLLTVFGDGDAERLWAWCVEHATEQPELYAEQARPYIEAWAAERALPLCVPIKEPDDLKILEKALPFAFADLHPRKLKPAVLKSKRARFIRALTLPDSGFSRNEGARVDAIVASKTLTNLHTLRFASGQGGEGLTRAVTAAAVGSLRHVHARRQVVGPQELRELARSEAAPRLRSLDLNIGRGYDEGDDEVLLEAFTQMGEHMTSLTRLGIYGGMEDARLVDALLASGLPERLEGFVVPRLRDYAPIARLFEDAQRWGKLRSLTLSSPPAELFSLLTGHALLPQLSELMLDSPGDVGTKRIDALFADGALSGLETLGVLDTTRNEEAIRPILAHARGLDGLRTLSLRRCWKLSGTLHETLEGVLPGGVRTLDLSGCNLKKPDYEALAALDALSQLELIIMGRTDASAGAWGNAWHPSDVAALEKSPRLRGVVAWAYTGMNDQ